MINNNPYEMFIPTNPNTCYSLIPLNSDKRNPFILVPAKSLSFLNLIIPAKP